MPYVHRTAQGEIDSLHRQPLPGASEFLSNDHPQVRRFIGQEDTPASFNELDAAFVRVAEDLIDSLLMKNLITVTELPAQAQAKLFARKNFRDKLSGKSLQLFPDSLFSEVIDDTGFGPL